MMKQSRLKLLLISVFVILITLIFELPFVLGQSLPGAPAVIDWSPDGTMIAGSGQGLLRIWDANTGATLIDFQGVSTAYVTAGLSWSPDSKRIVSAADDGVVRIWSVSFPNYSPGQLITTISPTTQDSGFVEDVAWSPNGQMIAVGRVYTRFTLEIWNATNYTFINHFAADWVTKLSWNATSSQIAYADQNSRLGILNNKSAILIREGNLARCCIP